MATLPSALALATIADGSPIIAADPRNNFSATQTAVNGLLTILGGGTNAQILQSGGGTTVNWAGAYSAYTPTWTASGTAPAIGNAAIVAQFLQLGKFVHAYGSITFGSTSTFGTGSYSWALPVTASANAGTGAGYFGNVFLFDSSSGNQGNATPQTSTASTMRITYEATKFGAGAAVGQLGPWTWAQSDTVAWNITYEAA